MKRRDATTTTGLLTLRVVDILEVVALDDLVYDVVSVHAGVVDPRQVTLNRVLLPPGGQDTAALCYSLLEEWTGND